MKKWLQNRNGCAHSVTYMSNSSQNEMIHLLGNAVREKVIQEVKGAGMFGISADTTPDLSSRPVGRRRTVHERYGASRTFFFSLRIFLLGKKLHMAWQQNLANAMARPRKLQHNTTKKIKSG